MMTEIAATTEPTVEPPACERCGKVASLCVCGDIAPLANRIEVVVLQHPQEQDRALGTARLTVLHFARARLKVGLSWPSLSKILGRTVDPQRWAVLYLGSLKAETIAPGAELVMVDRKGQAEPSQKALLRSIEGVILLDGNWSQAKALWWRNPWMLKCRRIILGPTTPSRYGHLRREPRRDGLSTLEAAGMLLSRLEGRGDIEAALLASFEKLLNRYRTIKKSTPDFDPPKASRSGRSKGARRKRRQSSAA
jgi:DTW domain-containing protein YfiP